MSTHDACPAWQEAISAYLDGVLPAGEEHAVHAHMRECAPCARFLVDLVPVVQALRAWPQPAPAHDPWPAIARQLASAPPFASAASPLVAFKRWRHPRVAAAAIAASLLVVAGSSWAYMQAQATRAPVAELGLYWQQHEAFSHDQALPTQYAPQLRAIDATYQLSP